MSEKEATEEQINDTLTKIMTSIDSSHAVKFLAKILFNVRFDLDELKIEVLKAIKAVIIESEPEPEELKYSDKDLKKIATTPERLSNDFYS